MQPENRVKLTGKLAADPIRPTTAAAAILLLDTDGSPHPSTLRINLEGDHAAAACESLKEGSRVSLDGHLESRRSEQDHVIRYTTEIVVDRLTVIAGYGNTHV